MSLKLEVGLLLQAGSSYCFRFVCVSSAVVVDARSENWVCIMPTQKTKVMMRAVFERMTSLPVLTVIVPLHVQGLHLWTLPWPRTQKITNHQIDMHQQMLRRQMKKKNIRSRKSRLCTLIRSNKVLRRLRWKTYYFMSGASSVALQHAASVKTVDKQAPRYLPFHSTLTTHIMPIVNTKMTRWNSKRHPRPSIHEIHYYLCIQHLHVHAFGCFSEET